MAEGTIKIKEMEELTELTDNDYFVVDNSASGVATKKYRATRIKDILDSIPELVAEFEPNVYYERDALVAHEGKVYYHNASGASYTEFPTGYQFMQTDLTSLLKRLGFGISIQHNSSFTYNKGDYCMEDYILYRCLKDNVTGSWRSTDWEQASLGYDLSHIYKPRLDEHDEQINSALAVGSASGDIASFSDGSNLPMPSLKVAIEPQQDLHGYDGPWVGGAGKNKFDSDTVLSAFTKNNNKYVGLPGAVVGSYVISGGFKTNTRYTLSYKAYNNTSTASNFRFVFIYTDGTEEIIGGFVDTTTEKVIVGTSAANKTISKITRNYGNGVEFTLYDIQLEEGSTATSYAPYSNICPISGWSAVDVNKSGVNIWDEEWEVGNINDGSGENLQQDNVIRSKNYISVISGESYYIECPTSGISRLFLYREDKSYITYVPIENITNNIYTIPNNCAFIRFRTLAAYGTTYNNDISINYPSTDTSYHAYNGATITIQLGDTYYGGKLDVVSGVLTVDRAYVKGVNVARVGQTDSGVHYADTTHIYADLVQNTTTISDRYKQINTSETGKSGHFRVYNGEFTIYDNRFTDVATAQSLLNDVEFCYELATPTTIQLTPTVVNSLLGSNNVWADTGKIIDCEYKRDATAIINSLIARIEALENQ